MSTTAAGNSPRTDELKNSRYISLGLTAETATQRLSEGEALLTFFFRKPIILFINLSVQSKICKGSEREPSETRR